MADLASQLVTYARSRWVPWTLMHDELLKRGVSAQNVSKVLGVLSDWADDPAEVVPWGSIEETLRAILSPIIDQPTPPSVGWTVPIKSTDTKTVHVSTSTGDDLRDGSTEAKAVRTFAKARTLIREGSPDWWLLKRGDTFPEHVGSLAGRSATEPMLLGAYGTGPRPKLVSPHGISPDGSFVQIMGLHLWGGYSTDSVAAGVGGLRSASDWLLEDLIIEGFAIGFMPQFSDSSPVSRNITLRRSSLFDNHSQGIFGNNMDGLLVEEVLLDDNGWNLSNDPADQFDHNVYLHKRTSNVRFLRCFSTKPSSHGMQLRGGGSVRECLFWRCAVSALFGTSDPQPQITVEALDNIFLASSDIGAQAGTGRGWGIDTQSVKSGVVARNLFFNAIGGAPHWLGINGSHNGGAHNLDVRDNVAHKAGGIELGGSPESRSGTTFTNNQETTDDSLYVEPHVTLSADFLASARQGYSAAWPAEFSRIKAGLQRVSP